MKLEFKYEERIIEFDLIYRDRKTVCIKIDESGAINVIAPMTIDNKRIIDIVSKKGDWIIRKQREMKKLKSNIIERRALEGFSFMYMGKEYPLHLNLNKSRKLIKVEIRNLNERDLVGYKVCDNTEKGEDKIIKRENLNKTHIIMHTNTLDEEKLKDALEKWYKERTYEIAKEKIEKYKDNFVDKVKEIKVKEQKRRWASCTGDNRILFNWRCSMAKEEVIEYIVVHEMCHMDFKDHSKQFWNRVEEIMPSYKVHHDWLKENGINMSIIKQKKNS